jgi:hypothetical protein
MDAHSLLDPHKVPVINLTTEELNECAGRISAGELPPDYLKRHFDAVNANVFGLDAPKDKAGLRVEQGLGSPRNQTRQSIDAFKKWHSQDPNFERDLAVMEKQLEASDRQRRTGERQPWQDFV